MKSVMLKEYIVCDEQINGFYCGCYTIRSIHDLYSPRFRVMGNFDTYEEAKEYIDYLYMKNIFSWFNSNN